MRAARGQEGIQAPTYAMLLIQSSATIGLAGAAGSPPGNLEATVHIVTGEAAKHADLIRHFESMTTRLPVALQLDQEHINSQNLELLDSSHTDAVNFLRSKKAFTQSAWHGSILPVLDRLQNSGKPAMPKCSQADDICD